MALEPLAYLHGDFLPQREAQLALNDAGFVMGVTVTDLCRTFQHRLFRLKDHLTRFRQSCGLAQVPQVKTDAELQAIAEQLVAQNAALIPEEHDLALVMFATPGPIGYYLGEVGGIDEAAPTLGMHTFPLPFARYARLFREGARLVLHPLRNAGVDPRIKQRSRLHWWLAERAVFDRIPGAQALLIDENGFVTETATANFLIVRQGAVISPPRASILGGISLLVTEEICHSLGIPFHEQPLTPADYLEADEALLTSTAYGIASVNDLNNIALSWPGPVYQRLAAAWNERAGLDIARQILQASGG